MQCLMCNQQDIVVKSEFYRMQMEECKNSGNVGWMVILVNSLADFKPTVKDKKQLD